MFQRTDFDALKLTLASPDEIKSWSHGEVLKPETINYRTLKPEKDGLFDERIFGPTKDYECYCGKYKRVRYKGVVCDKCGVEVTVSRVRRERMGHICLAAPVVHTWMFKRNPAVLPLLLDISLKNLESVIYFAENWVTFVDEGKKKEVLISLDAQFEQKKKDLHTQTNQKIVELQKETETAIAEIQKSKKALTEANELKIESLRANNRKEVLYLREELIGATQKLERLFEEIQTLIKETKVKSLLSENQLADLRFWQADNFFETKMGAEAILTLLKDLDFEKENQSLKKQLTAKSVATRKKAIKRLKVILGFQNAKLNPAWCILNILPVIPPDLRPMVQLPGGRFATSDLNDLYRRVINRNNRLKNLLNLGAPTIILQNEMRMLQEGMDALIEGPRKPSRRGRKELKSLAEVLRGKQGRFRQNLLGKRVDYSGRSVIVVGPELKIDRVGVPKEMALELFKPFVLRELILRGFAPNLKSAKNSLEARGDEVWDILEEVSVGRPVLLNRAPTLHRQNIQAFYPVLIEGNAIKLHPAVCNGYNADFDGDQMAVHVVLSERAIVEAKEKLLSPHNLLKLADAEPVIDLQKEFSVGLYYLTFLNPQKGEGKIRFLDAASAISAYQHKKIHLQALIQVYLGKDWLETTVGRLLFNEILPEKLRFFNQAVNRAAMRQLISLCFKYYGTERTVNLVDEFKEIGRNFATLPGISISVFDFRVPETKGEWLAQAEEKLGVIESNFRRGLMTERERRAQLISLWEETTHQISEEAVARIDPWGVLSIMIGAGGSRADKNMVRQVEGMRGLMVDSLGNIKETPIRSAIIEQASSYEGFLSSLGGRKGLIETALLTADAGYLTRRLVDVAHDVLVRESDCGSKEAWLVKDEGVADWSLKERIVGRVAATDIYEKNSKLKTQNSKPLVKRNEIITEEMADQIIKADINEVLIRSPLTCQAETGVCVLCYGVNMATGNLIGLGETVGVIAAQSIGEPGTQLTLRTFHAGGIAKKEITQGLPRVEELFEARLPKVAGLLSELSGKVRVKEAEDQKVILVEAEEVVNGKKVKDQRIYKIPATTEIRVKTGDLVSAGDLLTEGHLDLAEILRLRGMPAVQAYLLKEVQNVYKSQGVTINDKHIEIILRKLTDKVRIVRAGDSNFLPGQFIDLITLKKESQKLKALGKTPATGKPVILGLVRTALLADSWLSAASFIETSNVLTATAINVRPQIDYLLGLKENVIIGRLIPTGERARLETPFS